MRRFVVVHPQAAMDAAVLIVTGLALVGGKILLKFAHAGDNGLADFGGDEDQ